MPSRDYRDPLEILIERQEAELRRKHGPCYGCQHWSSIWGDKWCQKHQKPAVKKCKDFKES